VRSIRWKIVILCVLVSLVPLYILHRYTISTFDSFTRQNLEQQMRENAFIAGEEFKAIVSPDGSITSNQLAGFSELMEVYSREIQTRIQILSPAGIVLTDSATNTEVMADLSGKYEVVEALAGRQHSRCRMTADRQYMYYYVARPIKRDNTICGVAYLSRHTGPIIRAVKGIMAYQLTVIAVAMLTGLILSVILAQTITGRLRKLTAATAAFAKGNPDSLDLEIKGRDEVAELSSSIKAMAAELKRTNTYNREFISTVTHELKMPITAIRGAAELLEQGAINKEAARDKFLANIRFEAERMTRMVLELNELTKLDMETPYSRKEEVDYRQCVREIVERFETTLDPGHPRISLTVPEAGLKAMILPGLIEQVISNLLGNAIRYTPADGLIEVCVTQGPGKSVVTSVRDNGCGISASNLPKVFDRFFTTEPKTHVKDYGSGLGLAICKSIVESHHGTITVESVQGQGSTFTFILPAGPF
jgi:two-component system sensor histidine kinase ChvG